MDAVMAHAGVWGRAAAVWIALVGVAIANGLLREHLLLPRLGEAVGQPLSGLLLSLAVLVAAGLSARWIGAGGTAGWLAVGLFWVALTLLFEVGFGHWLRGIGWAELRAMFDPRTGNLMSLVVLVTLLAPLLAARLRGLP